MTNVPDLLEQFTWAINEGGPGIGGREEVYQFLSNVGRVILAKPSATAAAKPPTAPYAPDLLPMIQQMAWEAADSPFTTTSVSYFLQTVAWYLTGTGPRPNTPPYQTPTFPPLTTALQSLPIADIPDVYQIAYWLINEGISGNKKARAFIEAIGWYLGRPSPLTVQGNMRYPFPDKF
jgi:hypothetical protein